MWNDKFESTQRINLKRNSYIMCTKITAAAFIAVAHAIETKQAYGYKESGADWSSHAPFCDIGKEQSPIEL